PALGLACPTPLARALSGRRAGGLVDPSEEPMRRTLASLLAVLVLVAAPAPPATAWGPTGHRVVGRIAERHLTLEAARAVAGLLSPEQLAYVPTWADDIRSEPKWAMAEPWHWVTIPDGQTYESAPKNPGGDVLEAISRFQKVLADRRAPKLERAQAVKWLAHLVGDLHQPLHVGRGDDRGGNDVLVLWFNEPTNLHAVWDGKLVERTELSFSELADLLDHATPEEVRGWQTSSPLDWAAQSQQLRGACYEMGDRRLSYRYFHDHWPTVERRLLQAGVRLAGELNRLLGAP
ncbi:MAG TPA: S1/P1 nuclease, partial [Vicinamibacteria bacterium]|nr:S1/P1 nuclease [Vicinamibacteria bacterium]